jgi:hypothetical protein
VGGCRPPLELAALELSSLLLALLLLELLTVGCWVDVDELLCPGAALATTAESTPERAMPPATTQRVATETLRKPWSRAEESIVSVFAPWMRQA